MPTTIWELRVYEAGRAPEAVEQFQQSIQIDPNNAQAHYNLGNALLQIGQRDQAIEQFQTALRLRPDYAEAHNNLGSALLRAGRSEEAIEQYRQTVQLMPDHPKAFNNLAKAYAQVHRTSEAIATAEKGLDVARSTGQPALAEQIETLLSSLRAEQLNPQADASSQGAPAGP